MTRLLHRLSFLVGLAGAALAFGGCASPGLGAAHCPHPVLLGPVDRIGGHRAEPATTLGTVSGAAELALEVSKNNGKTTASASATSEGAKKLGAQIVARTGGHANRDVRVDRLRAGGWVLFMFTYARLEQWAELDARVVEVPRAR